MDSFLLPVELQNKEHEFPVTIIRRGYIYNFHVDLFGRSITIERDEEGNLRALTDPANPAEFSAHDKEVIEAVIKSLQTIV